MIRAIFTPFYFTFVNPYIWYVFIVFLFTSAIYFVFNLKDSLKDNKKLIYRIVSIILIYTQLLRYQFIYDSSVSFDIVTHLPFYICRISAWVLLVHTSVNSFVEFKLLTPFLFYWGATGLAGIIYPNGPIDNIPTLTQTFYIDHFLLGIFPFFLVAVEKYKPTMKHVFVISGIMFAMLLMFIPLNGIWGTDYFYLANQSIFGVLFPGSSSVTFAFVHSLAALCFFSIYYFAFREKAVE